MKIFKLFKINYYFLRTPGIRYPWNFITNLCLTRVTNGSGITYTRSIARTLLSRHGNKLVVIIDWKPKIDINIKLVLECFQNYFSFINALQAANTCAAGILATYFSIYAASTTMDKIQREGSRRHCQIDYLRCYISFKFDHAVPVQMLQQYN